jgi:hypothetical protein
MLNALNLQAAEWMPLQVGMLIGPSQVIRASPKSGARLRSLRTGGFIEVVENGMYVGGEEPLVVIHVYGDVRAPKHEFGPVELADFVVTLAARAASPDGSTSKPFHQIFGADSKYIVAEGRDVPKRFVGVLLDPVTGTNPRYVVREIVKDSPLAEQSIMPGDRLVAVNSRRLAGPADGDVQGFRAPELEEALNASGEKVKLTFERYGKQIVCEVRPVPRPTAFDCVITNKVGFGRYSIYLCAY